MTDLPLPHLMGLQLADTTYHLPGRIDILLGADLAPQIMVKQILRSGSKSEPIAQATEFGWAISGPVQRQNHSTHLILTDHHQTQPAETVLDNLLSEQPEEAEAPLSEIDNQVQQHYFNHVVYSPSDCRNDVTFSKKPDMQPLEESQTQALSKDLSDEGSILKRKIWQPSQEVIQNDLDLKHAEPVPASEPLPTQHHHLPQHAVFKESSTSNKIRVFDGSATTTSESYLYQSLDCNEEVPSELTDFHFKWRSELPLVSQTRLLRFYNLSDHSTLHQNLHGFSAASKRAFRAVMHSKTTYLDYPPTISLFISKTKNTSLQIWGPIPTTDHPTDYTSREMMPEERLNHSLWLKRPDWLSQEPIPVLKQPFRRTLITLKSIQSPSFWLPLLLLFKSAISLQTTTSLWLLLLGVYDSATGSCMTGLKTTPEANISQPQKSQKQNPGF